MDKVFLLCGQVVDKLLGFNNGFVIVVIALLEAGIDDDAQGRQRQ